MKLSSYFAKSFCIILNGKKPAIHYNKSKVFNVKMSFEKAFKQSPQDQSLIR